MRWLIVLLAACGRVGFEPVGSASGDDSTPPSDGRLGDGAMPVGGRDAHLGFCATLPCTNGNGASRQCAGNFCYAACSQAMTQAAGEAICEQWGGTLVSISNTIEESCATGVTTTEAWIGYEQSTAASDPAGGWAWRNGQPVGAPSWAPSSPDDGDSVENGAEQCATIDSAGAWRDHPCSEPHGFMCVR